MADATARFRIEGEDGTAAAFRSALGNAEKVASSMQAAFGAAFAGISVAAVAGLAKSAIEFGDNIGKAAAKSGIGAATFSSLAGAAKLADVELEALSSSLKKQQIFLSQAASGGKDQISTLSALGVSLKSIKGLRADTQFEVFAEAISKLKDPADRARAAVEIFGKAGAELLPLFEQGAAGIAKARDRARELGLTLSGEQIAKLQLADQSIKELQGSFDGLARTLTAAVAPALTGFFDSLRISLGGGSITETAQKKIAALKSQMMGLDPSSIEAKNKAAEVAQLEKLIAAQAKHNALLAQEQALVVQKAITPAKGFTDPAAQTALEKLTLAQYAARDAANAQTDSWLKMTETDAQKAAREVTEFRNALIDAQASGALTAEEATARWQAFTDKTLVEVQVGARKVSENFGEVKTSLTAFADQAARNMQSAFAQFLFDPFKGGVRGMVSGFLNAIRQMVAEVAASEILKALFGGFAGKGGFLGALGTAFGGGKATGGPVTAGTSYLVRDSGPEYLVPRTCGRLLPA